MNLTRTLAIEYADARVRGEAGLCHDGMALLLVASGAFGVAAAAPPWTGGAVRGGFSG